MFITCIGSAFYLVLLQKPLHSVIADIINNRPPPLPIIMRVYCNLKYPLYVETVHISNMKMRHEMVIACLTYRSTYALSNARKEVYVEVNYENTLC